MGSCGYDMEDGGCRWMVSKAVRGMQRLLFEKSAFEQGLFE
jgi:hypothetical protein